MKKVKIICTMGPNVDKDVSLLEGMIENGMNIARFNFSHGDLKEHGKRISLVKHTAQKMHKNISLLLDTKGPEMRLGRFADGKKVQLKQGQSFTLTYADTLGDENHVAISHKKLFTEIKPDNVLLLADGLIGLKVIEIKNRDIITEVLNSGEISDRKRVAAPGISLGLPIISEEDKKDIIFGIEQGMDFIAASFIQRASDVEAIRAILREHGSDMEIISKIECAEGVKNIDAIIAASDGIMVARGDLGVEIPAEDVPLLQKKIIKKCNEAGKPVIVATQMLESMIVNPRPTRAEASDIANAIFDGTDAIMLSGESANGKYPVEAVKIMDKIALRIEQELEYKKLFLHRGFSRQMSTTDVIAHATVQMAYELNAVAIVAPTKSGYTARVISKYRPQASILAYVSDEKVAHHLNLLWGVGTIKGDDWEDVDELITTAKKAVVDLHIAKPGDKIIVTAGMKLAEGDTTSIRVCTI